MSKKQSPWPVGIFQQNDWYYYSDDAFPPDRSVPVNRRNPRRKGKGRKTSAKQAAWRKKFGDITRLAREIQIERDCRYGDAFREARQRIEGGSRGNPGRYASSNDQRVSWPRYDEYQQVWGAYGPSVAQPPVNRRNPARKNSKYDMKAIGKFSKQLRRQGYDASTAMKMAWAAAKSGKI